MDLDGIWVYEDFDLDLYDDLMHHGHENQTTSQENGAVCILL